MHCNVFFFICNNIQIFFYHNTLERFHYKSGHLYTLQNNVKIYDFKLFAEILVLIIFLSVS